jgi:thioredoxin reductase (NADPH)
MGDSQRDIVIVGGGAAGFSAGLYASRAGLDTLLLERMMPGGQIVNAEKVENLPGFPDGIAGAEVGALLQDQATGFGLDVELSEVTGLEAGERRWTVRTTEGEMTAGAVIVAAGSTLKKLGIPGEDELHGAGVSYCATCDGGFFADESVAVVGGGDSALDEALVLTEFASRITIFHRRDRFSGQKVLQDRVLSHPKIEVRWDTVVDAILGNGLVNGVSVTDVASGETTRVDLTGIFIYVGLAPNSDFLSGLVPLDGAGHVPTDIWMRTPLPGLLAAGDIRQSSAAQLATATGDGATAAIAAQRYLEGRGWPA